MISHQLKTLFAATFVLLLSISNHCKVSLEAMFLERELCLVVAASLLKIYYTKTESSW